MFSSKCNFHLKILNHRHIKIWSCINVEIWCQFNHKIKHFSTLKFDVLSTLNSNVSALKPDIISTLKSDVISITKSNIFQRCFNVERRRWFNVDSTSVCLLGFPIESTLDSRLMTSVFVDFRSSSRVLMFHFIDLSVFCSSSMELILLSIIDNLESTELFFISIFDSLDFIWVSRLWVVERDTGLSLVCSSG